MQAPDIFGYTLLNEEGTGTFGTVFQARWNAEWECAVKVLAPEAVNAAYVSWCAEKLSAGESHPNIAAIYGFDLAHLPGYTSCAWIPRIPGVPHNMEEAAGTWTMDQAGVALTKLASAIAWLHERGIIHTGLTPKNVLLVDGTPDGVCVTDVGQGMVDGAQKADWLAHAPYFSPERCRGEAPQGESSGEAWDVFAFGVLAFKLLTGRLPRAEEYFRSLEKPKSRKKSQAGVLDLTVLAKRLENEAVVGWGSRASSGAELSMRRVIDRCLALLPGQRYAHMNEVLAELEQITGHMPLSIAKAPTTTSPPVAEKLPEAPAAVPATSKKSKGQKSTKSKPEAKEAAHTPSVPVPAPHSISIPADHEPVKSLKSVDIKHEPSHASFVNSSTWKWATAAAGFAALAGFAISIVQHRQKNALETQVAGLEASNERARKEAEENLLQAGKQTQTAQQAITEQDRLKLNLRQEQETSDALLATLIDQKPVADREIEAWADQLRAYEAQASQRLENLSKDPSLREATARTRWNLAGIKLALGEKAAAAEKLEAALRDVEAAAVATTNKQQHAEWDLLSGKILTRRGDLALLSGKSAEASQYLSQATKAIEAYLALMPDEPTALREYARATWLEGKALLAKPDAPAAIETLGKSTDAAGKLMISPAQRDEDIFQFVDSFQTMGRAHAAMKDDETALKDFLQPLEKLRLFERDHPKSDPARERLASTYVEMGRVLTRLGSVSEASQALTQGINVLLELVIEHPENEGYNLQVGTAYGDVARLVAEAKTPADSLSYAQRAVAYLSILVQKNRVEPEYRLHYAAELTNLAKIYEDVAKYDEALKTGTEAFALLDELAAETGIPSEDQSVVMNCLAMVQQTLGWSSEKLSKKDDAISWYSKAIEAWQKVAAGGPKDEKVQKSLSWTQDKLKNLRPGG